MTAQPEPPPGARRLVRPDGSVLVPQHLTTAVLRALVRDATAQARTNGGTLPVGSMALLWALQLATEQPSSAPGTHDRPPGNVEIGAGEAAALLGSSSEWVRRLARTGRVQARKAGPVWLIDAASLDAYRTGETTCQPSPPMPPPR